MEVFWDAGQTKFVLCASNGFAKASSVTEVEDVSYVCSPYIPSAARGGHIIFDMPMNNKDVARQVNGLGGWNGVGCGCVRMADGVGVEGLGGGGGGGSCMWPLLSRQPPS